MSKLVGILSFYLLGVYSAPCIPANTCFPGSVGDSSSALGVAADSALMWTCSEAGKVVTNFWNTLEIGDLNVGVCERLGISSSRTVTVQEADQKAFPGAIHTGMSADGSSSGAISSEYLQGTNCPGIDSSSNTCTDYFVVKRYGDADWEYGTSTLSYQNIGRGDSDQYVEAQGDCNGKESGTYAEADYWVIPLGCVNFVVAGSAEYYITSSNDDGKPAWGYQYYTDSDCTGDMKNAQSDEWVVGECGIFEERTHCGGQFNSRDDPLICSTGGVLVTYDYYFDLVCAPSPYTSYTISGQTCVAFYGSDGSQSNAPATVPTPEPSEPTYDPSCLGPCPGIPCCDAQPTSPTTPSGTPSSSTSLFTFNIYINILVI